MLDEEYRKKLPPEVADAMDQMMRERADAGLRLLVLCYNPEGRPRVFDRYCASREEFEQIAAMVDAHPEDRLLSASEAGEWEQTHDVPEAAKAWLQRGCDQT